MDFPDNFFDEVSDLSLEDLSKHVISERNGIILEAVNGVCALLNDLCHKLLGNAFYNLFLGQLGSLCLNVILVCSLLGPLSIIDSLYRFLKYLANKTLLEKVASLHVTIHQNLVDYIITDPLHCLGGDLFLILSLSITSFLLRIFLEFEFRRRWAIVVGLVYPGLRAKIAVLGGTAWGRHHVVHVGSLGTDGCMSLEVSRHRNLRLGLKWPLRTGMLADVLGALLIRLTHYGHCDLLLVSSLDNYLWLSLEVGFRWL